MRENMGLYRGKRLDTGEWVEGYFVMANGRINNGKCYILFEANNFRHSDGNVAVIGSFVEVDPSTVGQDTGLYDKDGNKIFTGDVLRFDDKDGIWQSAVVFERGLFGLDVYHPKQIKNPDGWDMKHDRVKSRWWGCRWGYEEFGTAFTYRQPLAIATVFRGDREDYQKSEIKQWHEKHGYDKYVVWAVVIGNVHDNPELKGDC